MKVFKFRFTSIFFYLTLCFVTAAVILTVIKFQDPVKDWLSDYENSLPRYKVEEIFREYFEEPDAERLIALSDTKPEYYAPDTFEDALACFRSRIYGKSITYGYIAGTNRMTVNVKAGGEKFARFSIKESEEKSKYGRTLYELDSITLFYDTPTASGKVKLPERFTAYANGMELDENYLTADGIKEDNRDFIPAGAYFFTYKKYAIGKLYKEPGFTVLDENGNEVPLEYDEENGEYFFKYDYSDVLKEEYGEYALEALQKYAIYMQNDAKFKTIKEYFDPESDLYQNIYENPGSFVWEHDGYRFENSSVSEFFDYGEVMSCRVAFDHVLEKKKAEDYIDKIDLTVYMKKIDGVYKIFYMVTN